MGIVCGISFIGIINLDMFVLIELISSSRRV